MDRRRLIVKPIQNKKVRNATFQRRKKGLLKKASEFCTLCGVNACVIIFPPEGEPETWPQDPRDVIGIIEKYNDKNKSQKKPRKNYGLHEFFNDRKKQVEAETSKVRQQRLNMSYPTWNHSFDNLGEDQLRVFVNALDSKLEECNQRIDDLLKKKKMQYLMQKAAESESVGLVLPDSSFLQNMSQGNFFPASQSQSQAHMLHFDSDPVLGSYTSQLSSDAMKYGFGYDYDPTFTVLEENASENYNPNSINFPDLQNIACQDSFSLVNYGSNWDIETIPLSLSQSSLVACEDLKYQEAAFLQSFAPLIHGVQTNGYYNML